MFVYLLTNSVNGKYYIGKYEGKVLSTYIKRTFREAQSGSQGKTALYNAIRKYGKDKFSFKILLKTPSKSATRFWEAFFIEFTDARVYGYNISSGYEPPSRVGKKNTLEHNRKIGLANKGHIVSQSQRRAIAARQKGHVSTKAQKHSLLIGQKRPRTIEQRAKLSLATRQRWQALSEEDRDKHAERTRQSWEKRKLLKGLSNAETR